MTLSVQDIAGMRATVDTSLPDVCRIVTDAPVSDGAGGHTITTTIGAPIACRIAPRLATGTGQLKDAETIEGERLLAQAPWMVTFPANTVVGADQRILDEDDRAFEVFAVLARRSTELATRVLCRLINDGRG